MGEVSHRVLCQMLGQDIGIRLCLPSLAPPFPKPDAATRSSFGRLGAGVHPLAHLALRRLRTCAHATVVFAAPLPVFTAQGGDHDLAGLALAIPGTASALPEELVQDLRREDFADQIIECA